MMGAITKYGDFEFNSGMEDGSKTAKWLAFHPGEIRMLDLVLGFWALVGDPDVTPRSPLENVSGQTVRHLILKRHSSLSFPFPPSQFLSLYLSPTCRQLAHAVCPHSRISFPLDLANRERTTTAVVRSKRTSGRGDST